MKDEIEGEKWLERAAEHGNFEAQCKLAIRLMQGVGVPRDATQAVKWWRWAAERGYPQAQNDLGYALQTGDAGTVDLVEACKWLQLAAKAGEEKAKINLAGLSAKLTDDQRREASQRANDFQPQPMPQLNPVQRNGDAGTPIVDTPSDQ
jgi:TPR repeat protein